MKLKTYTSEDFYKARCVDCSWIQDESHKVLPEGATCPNCENVSYTHFPNSQSAHILGGMIHFIDSYNQKIEHDRHIFPPQVYLPIIFTCSNYEILLADLVRDLMKQYGKYIGRLGHFLVFDEVLSSYDKKANEKIFKALTLQSIQEAVQTEFPHYFVELHDMYKVRNNVVHGSELDNTEKALTTPNRAIDLFLESVDVFRYLNNHFVVSFKDNIDYRKVLRLGEDQDFQP